MSTGPAKKLSRMERREQLLDCAMTMVREGGADALTLGRLAEWAGVSKPVAYDHFGTREALMIALYRRIDEQQGGALAEALGQLEPRLDKVARAVAESYLSCATSIGPEWHSLSAALKGTEAMEAVQRELVDGYISLYREALAPYAGQLSAEDLHLCCVAILGAAESVSGEVLRGRANEAGATELLAALIVRLVQSSGAS
ncbi:TetR/AcrR family transcriptional regulator [Bosea sp. BIWAKO-01]|uniref:TetR/AcrR family transcriptional regulator n=1 Tax=Bosea sp. BIWAKO-01 TaxID=506668 RepID=UPI0008534648|nr:TetR/AcrR family transcriptional regulator [Bosea sp. BIWAKO-01]GAU84084.1 transcriptional regulator of TetR family [Bosea sp. BIWAKO-01]